MMYDAENSDFNLSPAMTVATEQLSGAPDSVSITSDASVEQTDHQQLHQTTQSLLMASSMIAGTIGGSADLLTGALPLIANSSHACDSTASMSTTVSAISTIKISLEELLRENYVLRERLKEVTSDRDRLLCEVSNLRLELDMSELKQLPEESFPQKPMERSSSAQHCITAPVVSMSATPVPPLGNGGGNGYIYLQQQQQYTPAAGSLNSSVAINYPPASQQQQQMIYHNYNQHYPTCQQPQLIHQASASGGVSNMSPLYSSSQMIIAGNAGAHYNPHQQHVIHGHHHSHHHHHGGAVVIAGSGVGIGGAGNAASVAMQQNMLKKSSIRSGVDVLKRSRAQTAYELSQDLLEKQIELLERKYGGVRARNAAITIQRAFRHYMMVKKFASITAMAKAEKRLSRRMLITSADNGPSSNNSSTSAYVSAAESQIEMAQVQSQAVLAQEQHQPRITIMAGGPPGSTGPGACSAVPARTAPMRSLSLRERRQLDASPIPRSQSGVSNAESACPPSNSSAGAASAHPHVNLLHVAEPHYYSGVAMSQQFYPSHYSGVTYHAIPHDVSFSSVGSSNSHLDASLNASWVSVSGSSISGASPHSPYYSATQIYMRPKALTSADRKKVPPEVPKRTSSITAQQQAAAQQLAAQQHQQQIMMMRQTPPPAAAMMRSNGLCKTAENGSLSSVQSSGSDSSVTSTERVALNSDIGSDRSNSPHTWRRGSNLNRSNQFSHSPDPAALLMSAAHPLGIERGNVQAIMATATPSAQSDESVTSHRSAAQYGQHEQQDHQIHVIGPATQNYKVSETIRKRQFRVGLNLFNKKPEKGITYFIRRGFIENTPQGVARFLIFRRGLSRQMIGEYLGNLQNPFNMAVLNCFALELDLSGMQVDEALRKFQTYFRMPGEAQKIERLMEVFSQRYCQCNQDIVGRLRSSDTIFVLAFAIIMLNTDLHTPNLKPERRMRVEDFVKNLRGIDDCHDIDKDMLGGIYERVKTDEFKPSSDHVTQVMKVQATIVGKKLNLALPHRRLVSYCRLYEVPDVNKKERPGVHQREVFLFNDLLVITKIFSKKKSSVTYTFRNSFTLCGIVLTLLDLPNYPFCIQLTQKVDGKNLITFNARNEHDRCKFAEDLKEYIIEMDEMEALRIEAEMDRQKSSRNRAAATSSNAENRDSGVADVEVCPCPFQAPPTSDSTANGGVSEPAQQLKRSALSNSLLDMHEQFGADKPQRRGSVGSLDSGMSISFQSTTASSASRENAAAAANAAATKIRLPPTAAVGAAPFPHQAGPSYVHANLMHHQQAAFAQHLIQQQMVQQQPFLVGRLPGRDRKLSRSEENGRSTDV